MGIISQPILFKLLKTKSLPNFVQQLSSFMLGESELALAIACSTMLTSPWRNRAAASEKQQFPLWLIEELLKTMLYQEEQK